jgi:HEPN domain-containing protein
MKRRDDPEVAEWLDRAAEDLRVADILYAQPEPLQDPICFHCQQAAEKSLKAVLVAGGQAPPRIHDLEAIASAVPVAVPDDVLAALPFLTPFAVIPRYPVPLGTRAPDRAVRALLHARAVLAWAAGILAPGPGH